MTRIEKQIKEWKKEGLTGYEIACGLNNGDLERPDWMGKKEEPDGVEIYDMEKDPFGSFPYFFG